MKQALPVTLTAILALLFPVAHAGDKTPATISLKRHTNEINMISSTLFAANGNVADGNMVVFDPIYSNAVDGNDAIKLLNPGENFGLKRNTSILAVEARQPIADGDSIFYYLANLVPQVYQLRIIPQHLSGTVINCQLIDRFLHTTSSISLSDSNHFSLEVTQDPASRASDRLIIVFSRQATITPFAFQKISATSIGNKSVTLSWKVNQELNTAGYEIERSADNIHYTAYASILPVFNDQGGGNYEWPDRQPLSADNFYRVKAVDKNGGSVYSDKVQVFIKVPQTMMNIYPNPVVNHVCEVQLQQLSPGKYFLQVTNSSGQSVYSRPVNAAGNITYQTIRLNNNIGKGNYNVSLVSAEGIIATQKIIVP